MEDLAYAWLSPCQFLFLDYPTCFILHMCFKQRMHPVSWEIITLSDFQYVSKTCFVISLLVYLFTHLPDCRVWPIFVVLRSWPRCLWGGAGGGGRWAATCNRMASWQCHLDIWSIFEMHTFWEFRLTHFGRIFFWLYWPLLVIILGMFNELLFCLNF